MSGTSSKMKIGVFQPILARCLWVNTILNSLL